MEVPSTEILSSSEIKQKLKETETIIQAIYQNQNIGKLLECSQYLGLLQKKLISLAQIAGLPHSEISRPWDQEEIDRLTLALNNYGPSNLQVLAKFVVTRNTSEIEQYLRCSVADTQIQQQITASRKQQRSGTDTHTGHVTSIPTITEHLVMESTSAPKYEKNNQSLPFGNASDQHTPLAGHTYTQPIRISQGNSTLGTEMQSTGPAISISFHSSEPSGPTKLSSSPNSVYVGTQYNLGSSGSIRISQNVSTSTQQPISPNGLSPAGITPPGMNQSYISMDKTTLYTPSNPPRPGSPRSPRSPKSPKSPIEDQSTKGSSSTYTPTSQPQPLPNQLTVSSSSVPSSSPPQ